MKKHTPKVVTTICQQALPKSRRVKNTFLKEAVRQAVRVINIPSLTVPLADLSPESRQTIADVSLVKTSLIITDDEHIREINREYRDIDAPTDVISFSQIEGGTPIVVFPSEPLLLGEIIISIDAAMRQAAEDHIGVRHMLAWLIAHGCLHLLGFDHPTEADRMLMREYELKIVKALGFGNLPKMAVINYEHGKD